MFDGKTLNGWKRVVGTGEYTVENNMIVGTTVANSPNTFLATEKEYSDFVLEFDAKIDDTASNSGVQIRSHFDPNENNGKGRVYGYQLKKIHHHVHGAAAFMKKQKEAGYILLR